MRVLIFALAAMLGGATAASAQPPHPDCAKLPNGGKLRIDVPGTTTAPTCQACAADFQIPANFVLGFSTNLRGTCELKRPDGTNSGLCRAATQCPFGTERVRQGDEFVCRSPASTQEIDCPAPPSAPAAPTAPPVVRTPSAPPQPPACVQQIKAIDTRLKQTEGSIRRTIETDASVRGTALATAALKRVEAFALMSAIAVQMYGEVVPLRLTSYAACNGIDRTNKTAVADCNRATTAAKVSVERREGLLTRYRNASAASISELREATAGTPRTSLVEAIDTASNEAAEAAQQVEACLAEVHKKFGLPF